MFFLNVDYYYYLLFQDQLYDLSRMFLIYNKYYKMNWSLQQTFNFCVNRIFNKDRLPMSGAARRYYIRYVDKMWKAISLLVEYCTNMTIPPAIFKETMIYFHKYCNIVLTNKIKSVMVVSLAFVMMDRFDMRIAKRMLRTRFSMKKIRKRSLMLNKNASWVTKYINDDNFKVAL